MIESRSSARNRVLKAGTIDLGGGAIDCTVRNLSATGAALDVTDQAGIPERFTLVVSADGARLAALLCLGAGGNCGRAGEPELLAELLHRLLGLLSTQPYWCTGFYAVTHQFNINALSSRV